MSLHKKSILITGASSGIGKAAAILCSTIGAKCIITGRDLNRLSEVLKILSGEGHSLFVADLADQNDIAQIVQICPNLDGVLHCAGIIQLLPYKSISLKAFEKIMSINFYAPFFLTQELLKKKKINNNSAITFISSISGNIVGAKGNLMYSGSKSALNGIIKVLSLELAEKKIRVNGVSAGMVKTEMWINEKMLLSEDQLIKDEEKYPLGYGQPEDVANIAVFLLTDSAKWITGTTIIADGGFSTQ